MVVINCLFSLKIQKQGKVVLMNKLFTGLLVLCASVVLSGAVFACDCGCNCAKDCQCKQECASDCTCGCQEGKTCECQKQGCECQKQTCNCCKTKVFKFFRKSKCECK